MACFCLLRDVRVSSRFPCVTLGVKRFSLDFSRVFKKYRECVLEVECRREGVGVFRELIEFVTTEFFLFW